MASWKRMIISRKSRGTKQLSTSDNTPAGEASASSASNPIAGAHGEEQQSPVSLEEASSGLTFVNSPMSTTATASPVAANSTTELARQPVENFGLFELPQKDPHPAHSPPTPPNVRHVNIVAVHGLGGNWQSTWTAEDGAMWLRDRLPDILAEANIVARVQLFGYDSATVFTRSVADLQTAARTLLVRLRGSRKTQQQRAAPIIFVCHSLGGLVVKEALIQAWNRSSHNEDILEKARACLFLAVPHRGSGLADWADGPAKLLKILSMGFAGNSNFTSVLRSSSKDWVRLSENFIDRANRIYFRSFFETDRYGNQIIVNEGSAAMHIGTEQVIPLEGSNHQTICKFRADEDQRFSPVGDAILELADIVLPSAEEVENQTISIRCREHFPTATHTFFGRKSELRTIEAALDPAKAGQKGIVLYGMPGAGKTQLALRYAESHRKLFASIFWITASSPETIASSFSAAATLIASSWPAQDLPNPRRDGDDTQTVVSRLRSTLHRSWLLIIDSADNVLDEDFTKYIPACQHGSIIITSTRREAVDVFGMNPQEIRGLDAENGQRLLLARIPNPRTPVTSLLPISAEDDVAAKAILKELDCLPLAIEYAAALVQRNRFTLNSFVLGYREHYHRLTNEKLPKGLVKYEKSLGLFTLVEMLHSTVQNESPDAAALLTLLAFLGPWRFPLAMFRVPPKDHNGGPHNAVMIRLGSAHLKAILTDDVLLSLAVSHLCDACLIKAAGDLRLPESVSVHNIVCQWILETAGEKEQWVFAATATLSAYTLKSQQKILFPYLGQQGTTRLHLAPLERSESLFSRYLKPDELAQGDCYALVYGDLENSLALANLQAGRVNAAQTHFRRAIDCMRLRQGEDWPNGEAALWLLYGLAITYQKEKDTDGATEVLKSVLELALKTLDEFDDRTVEINARSKAVADLAERNLRHHKGALLATTADSGPKPGLEAQLLRGRSRTAIPDSQTPDQLGDAVPPYSQVPQDRYTGPSTGLRPLIPNTSKNRRVRSGVTWAEVSFGKRPP